MTRIRLWMWSVALLTPALMAQTPTGAITGRVTASGQPLAGAMVTATTPAAAPRTAITAPDGAFTISALPAGRYSVRFEYPQLQPQTQRVDLHVAETLRADAELHALQRESIEVTGPAGVTDTPQVAASYDAHLIEILPIARGITDVVRIAPGVQDTGGQGFLMINGGPSYDNLYLVDGVTIALETTGQPHNLFIEDAIQEVNVLEGAISPEYGRFTGGVVTVVTKSGGNELSGSLRDTLTSDRWTARSAYPEPPHLHQIDDNYEATLGGRIVRDRLWFFTAGHYARRNDARATFGTNIPYTHALRDTRWEAKVTATITPRHMLVGSYLDATAKRINDSIGGVADLNALFTARVPNSLATLHYTGIAGNDLVGELQYSRKHYDTSQIGARSTDPINGTTIFSTTGEASAWSPILCGVCGPSYRDNHDLIARLGWFLTTSRFGAHNIVAGADDFRESGLENDHQTGSDYSLYTPVAYSGQSLVVQAVPGVTNIVWQPILQPAVAAKFRSLGVYANDRVDLGTHVSVSAGLRYDKNHGHDTSGTLAVDDSRLSPRAGVIYDVAGNGRHRLSASYSVYTAKIAQPVTDQVSIGGAPAFFYYDYEGPEINTSGPVLPPQEVLRQVFDWFNAEGKSDPSLLLGSFLPGGETFVGPLQSPYVRELTAGYAVASARGMLRADYIRRRWGSFYARRVTTANGTVQLGDAPADRVFIENSDAGLERRYHGVLTQGTYRLGHFTAGGNYTWSKLYGNVENELGGVATAVPEPGAFYPEYLGFAQNAPRGPLAGDVRNRLNVWLVWSQPARVGDFEVSALERYHSARNYNATGVLDLRRIVRNPGYATLPAATYYFAPRGSLHVDSVSATDVGVNWSLHVAQAQLFVEADLQNAFNEQAIENPGGIQRQVVTSRLDRNLAAFNPFTTTPVECPRGTPTSSAQCKGIANYQLAAKFGQPINKTAYQTPRTFRVSVGARF
jgi:Carboxypeptidase regulatory-like domain/TonB dependent receptor/TonB-dependent Receptor Plug Domain